MPITLEYVYGRDSIISDGFTISEKRGARLTEVLRLWPVHSNKTPEAKALLEDTTESVVMLLERGLNSEQLADILDAHDRRADS